jgi:ParB family chromosome partitioning protein
MKGKKVLGKGLEALLPDRIDQLSQAVIEVSIDEIVPSKYQPRMKFDKDSLESLAESIKRNGVLQPLLLRKIGDKYQIVAGERRWKAAKMAGLTTVPAIIRDVVDSEVLELALIENLQREDLNPIEEAMAFKTMIDEFKLTHEELAKRIGKDRSSITNSLRLLKLPEEIKNMLIEGQITMGHGRALASIEDLKLQLDIAKRIIKQGLTVRAVERLLSERKKPALKKPDPNVKTVEDKLQHFLSTKVKIVSNKNRGKIIIYFYSIDEFDRIYELLTKES